MNIVNLTPHALNIYDENRNLVLVVEPSGTVARVNVTRKLHRHLEGIPLYSTWYGDLLGLPEAEDNTICVVSAMVRAAVPHRHEVFAPGELLRNEAGQVIGCIGLQQ